ncbi:MAG: hypothetical protein R3A52_13070 [Polyangiales bacterium]
MSTARVAARALWLTSSLLSCRRAPPAPAPHVAARDAAVDVGVDVGPATVEPPDALCVPAVAAPRPGGAVVAWSCYDPVLREGEVFAWLYDADALPVRAPSRVATTRGAAVSLSVSASADAVWVGWITHEGEGSDRADGVTDRGHGSRVVTVLRASADLATVDVPTTLSRFTLPDAATGEGRWWPRASIVVGADAEGALAVYTDAMGACTRDPDGRPLPRPIPCATWTESRVSPTEPTRRLRHEVTRAPSMEPRSLVRAGGGWLYLRGSDFVRSTLTPIESVPQGRASALPQSFRAPLVDWSAGDLAFTGDALVALGTERSLDGRPPRAVVRALAHRPRPHPAPRFGRGDALDQLARAHRGHLACASDRPVVRVRWGSRGVDLDPGAAARPSTSAASSTPPRSMRPPRATPRGGLELAWAGNALLAITSEGAVRRYRCVDRRPTPMEP